MIPLDGEVDYSTCSSEELQDARNRIDPAGYPLNFRNLLDEIAKRDIPAGDSPDAREDSVAPLTRTRASLAAVIFVAMACIHSYGIERFPDSPIRPCGVDQYCGKQGQAHTSEDFTAYRRWETAMLVTWPAGMLSLFLLLRRGRARRPRGTMA
jgi:hypothetical protein